MNFTSQQRAWILLICIVLGTGSTVTIASYTGGAKLWVAVLCGLGTGATNVWLALSESPRDKSNEKPIPAPPVGP